MTRTSTLQDLGVERALSRMFARAEHGDVTSDALVADRPTGYVPTTSQERADEGAAICMPISAECGRLLHTLVRASRPTTVVEFGTSFGISTLHLAAAVRDNGRGHVFTTELSRTKTTAARRTFTETGLDDVVTVLEGDALDTLTTLDGPVDLVLLDGWKDLCLPVLHLLEPHLSPGALVVADDTTFTSMAPYLAYVRTPSNGYQSVDFPVEDGMEISCRV
ncbi:class I SAM-dependent methyltransferase [Umezawaea sp. Da 62-37]|uniref:O-methyltransferase n=1 Tax=Umezawaea sp. Da 62-37 TaxID=3075927 RepID=UPI0028F72BBF|nr:class I SAM-dependent methyltransferase [Umezawaea sp. Da 62-37]WNV86444.1 class I SAM-dependent methyltransferase [Umezawaea sp. Da 62-37]